MRVFETELPGVGRRYTVEFADGRRLTVLLYNDGRRETFWRAEEDDDSERLFTLSEPQARKIAEIFDGTYFTPVADELGDTLDHARIRWVELTEDDPLVGLSLGESALRSETGVLVIGVQRGDRTIGNPTADTVLRAGDVLVTVGSDEAHDRLTELLT
ncbi:cation:proton antiporter regulatory subunit [Halomicroarcula sp. GCM10025817]|uniref:cation:proton antiporter regulatory subunit n=1 Tax=Haloarcula TaxID=2237 RepID=UPI0023E77685|nr:TrkA C-terminal domain-containing protein [Halomicroarcula sp. SYNS111]